MQGANERDLLFLTLSNKYLRGPIESIDELIILNTSGFSNETFIVSCKHNPSDKIVIRLFKSKASDFVTESHIYRLMG